MSRQKIGQDTSSTDLPSLLPKKKKPPYKFKRLKEVPMKKAMIEDLISENVSRLLRGSGIIEHSESVTCSLPGGDIIMLPIKTQKQSDDERLVFEVL